MIKDLFTGKYEYPFTEPKVYFTMYQIHLYERERDHLGINVSWTDSKKSMKGDESITWEQIKDDTNWKEHLSFRLRKIIDGCIK